MRFYKSPDIYIHTCKCIRSTREPASAVRLLEVVFVLVESSHGVFSVPTHTHRADGISEGLFRLPLRSLAASHSVIVIEGYIEEQRGLYHRSGFFRVTLIHNDARTVRVPPDKYTTQISTNKRQRLCTRCHLAFQWLSERVSIICFLISLAKLLSHRRRIYVQKSSFHRCP